MSQRPFRVVADVRDRPAWLAARRRMLTASDAAACLGASRWRSAADVATAKASGDELVDTEAMALGRALEEPVLRYWAQISGRRVRRARHLLASVSRPWLGASPDAWAYDDVDGFAAVEIKVTSSRWGAEPPPDYEIQCRVQMAVTGVRLVHLVGLCGSTTLRRFRIAHDPVEEQRILGQLEKVWNECILPSVRRVDSNMTAGW